MRRSSTCGSARRRSNPSRKDREGASSLLKASEIVDYLRRTLDHAQSPELCSNLSAVYTFVCARLISGTGPKALAAVREAEKAFLPLAEAFREAVRQRGAA